MPDIASIVAKPPSLDDNLSSIRLPIIDIGPYLDPSSSADARKVTASSIDKACREFGFLYVTGHGIPQDRLDALLELGRQFFELPQDVKDSIHISKSMDGVRGYQKIGENVTYAKRDQQEAIDIYPEPAAPTTDQLNGSQLWPSEEMVPGLKATVLDYTVTMKKIGLAFMQAMSDAFGHDDIWRQLSEDNYWVLRMIGYPGLPEDHDNEQGISCGAHTDYGCLTFLLADPIPGALQVEAKNGQWIPADPVPGAFVVNIGDILDVLTSHQYKSTYHRVIHRGSKYRVSVPFFFEPKKDWLVRPIEDVGKPVTEGELTYFQHLKNMIYRHFVPQDQPLPGKPNANELTARG